MNAWLSALVVLWLTIGTIVSWRNSEPKTVGDILACCLFGGVVAPFIILAACIVWILKLRVLK